MAERAIATIPLTRGYTAMVDAEDLPLVQDLSWQVLTTNGHAYAVHSWRDGIGGPSRKTYLHHVIADAARAPIRKPLNKNALDCRKVNFGCALAIREDA